MEDKHQDSAKYPKIVRALCTTVGVVGDYIEREIARIDPADVAESRAEGKEYPTVLVAGPGHYLREIHKRLSRTYPQISYSPSQALSADIIDAYKTLITDENSNFGWRLLVHVLCDEDTQKRVVIGSEKGAHVRELLNEQFVATHLEAVHLARAVIVGERALDEVRTRLKELLEANAQAVLSWLTQEDTEDAAVLDRDRPSILLTTYKGCKGLSAGHVFIVGIHDGSLPKNRSAIDDREISLFVVALTRTRKQCHLLANKWFIAPVDANQQYIAPFQASAFADWIPNDLVRNLGTVSAKDLR